MLKLLVHNVSLGLLKVKVTDSQHVSIPEYTHEVTMYKTTQFYVEILPAK
jgi:hypothetical protein